MITLFNVTQEESTDIPCIGLTSNALPKVINKGVSVEYAYDLKKQWYVLRISYNRISKALDIIDTNKAKIYNPTRTVIKYIKGEKRRLEKPLLPNLIFVYTTPDYMEEVIKKSKEYHNKCITYYYNHFSTNKEGKNPPLIINERDMMNFIKLTSVQSEHIKLVSPEHCHYKSGDNVRIVDGDFAGVVGRVARISGQQRIVVEIQGVCMVATAYIPSAFLEYK